jgi:hypothetical protein
MFPCASLHGGIHRDVRCVPLGYENGNPNVEAVTVVRVEQKVIDILKPICYAGL